MRRRNAPPPDDPPADAGSPDVAPHDEVMAAILARMQSLDERLSRVEALLAETEVDRLYQADHSDLIEVRLHSARLAAELSRVTVALQARIDDLAARSGVEVPIEVEPVGPPDLPPPIVTEQSSGWEPTATD